jgi:hypothetical protein
MAKAPHGQSKGDDDGLLKGAAVEIMDRLFGMRKCKISGKFRTPAKSYAFNQETDTR